MIRVARVDARCRAKGCHRPADVLTVLARRSGRYYAAQARCWRHEPATGDQYGIRLWGSDGALRSRAARADWLDHLKEMPDGRWWALRAFLAGVDRRAGRRVRLQAWRVTVEGRRIAGLERRARESARRVARLRALELRSERTLVAAAPLIGWPLR